MRHVPCMGMGVLEEHRSAAVRMNHWLPRVTAQPASKACASMRRRNAPQGRAMRQRRRSVAWAWLRTMFGLLRPSTAWVDEQARGSQLAQILGNSRLGDFAFLSRTSLQLVESFRMVPLLLCNSYSFWISTPHPKDLLALT